MNNKIVILITITLSFIVVGLKAAEIVNKKAAFAKTNKLKMTDVLLSKTSKYCHPPESRSWTEIAISSDRSNIYPDLKTCIKSGAELVPFLKSVIQTQSPESHQEISKSEENAKKENTENNEFFGISWGLGFAYTSLSAERVIDVTIESAGDMNPSVISVNKSKNSNIIALLETHYFFGRNSEDKTWGHGPFVSIGLTGNDNVDPLSTFGAGWMVGLKREEGKSFNVGLGYFVDTAVPQLRSGIIDGATTTLTDPSKLLIEKDEEGLMVMFSFDF